MAAKRTSSTETFLCDTSVLIAAADLRHTHHTASIAVVRTATKAHAFCSAHTVAEVYATLTSAAYRGRLRSADVGDVLDRIRRTFTVIGLTPTEYFAVTQDGLARGAQSGQIYDALHLAAAAKADVGCVYTWHVKHFQALAPASIVDLIHTP